MKTLALLSLLIGLAAASCNRIKDPEFRRLEKFGVKSFGVQKVDIGFQVTYFNPNNFGVTVKEAAGDVYLDSVFVGKFVQHDAVEVDKNAEFSIPLVGSVALADALKLKVNDLANRELLVRANGSVKVGKAGVYISRPFTYQGKHKIDLRL
jgi:LEA14-like dessication related protein